MQPNDVKIIAHQAGNSIYSFSNAVIEGADYIELDIHLSKDNVLIVQHLPYISVNGLKYYIEDFTSSDLQSYGNLLFFDQILELAKYKNIRILVDIKKGKRFYENIHDVLIKSVSKHAMIDIVEVLSFDHLCIEEIKCINSKIKAGIMYVARMSKLRDYLNMCKPDFIEICGDYLDEESIRTAQNIGIDVYGWGSDDIETLQFYRNVGMYAVTVNDVRNAVHFLRGNYAKV